MPSKRDKVKREENLKIKIADKYLYISGENNRPLAYFEHFESLDEKHSVIKLAIQDRTGEYFIKGSNGCIVDADVYWFSGKKLRYKVLFVQEKNGAFHYLVLIVPKLLKI